MYNENVLLNKAGSGVSLTLADLCGLSGAEIKSRYEGELSWGESQYLSQQAAEAEKENRMLEARIFSRANPQLASAIRLGLRQASQSRSYNSLFGSRASAFVSPDSVASMFSPAAYLTILYREAQELHFPSSAFHLNTRRPDLASLQLNQKNMDQELPTLTLSNEVLAEHIARQQDTTTEALLKKLATHRQLAQAPYHQPCETIRQVILDKQPDLSVLSRNPDVAGEDGIGTLLAIMANISPELEQILSEDITEQNTAALYKKNFDQEASLFESLEYLADYFGITPQELAGFIGGTNKLFNDHDILQSSGSVYVDGYFTSTAILNNGTLEKFQFRIVDSVNSGQHHYLELVPLGGRRFSVRFNVSSTIAESSAFSLRTAPTGGELYREDGFVPQAGEHYVKEITLAEDALENEMTIGIRRARSDTGSYHWSSVTFKIEHLSLEAYMLKLNKAIRLCQATGLSPSQLESLVFSDNDHGVINRSVLGRLLSSLFYQARYGLELDDALVLCGADISNQPADSNASQFDRIFNSPPLGGTVFAARSEPVILQPDEGEESLSTAVLKRGLEVNSGELVTLCRLVDRSITDTISGDIKTLSHLWRLRLLSRAHNLSVLELNLLYQLSPCNGLDVKSLSLSQWRALTEFMYQTTHLTGEMGLSAGEFYMLCTLESAENLTPEIMNLLSAIRIRMAGTDAVGQDAETLAGFLSPLISAALSLSSPEMGRYVLLWTEMLRPDVLSVVKFAELAILKELTSQESILLARFCHALAQTSMIVQKLMLSEAEVASLVNSDNQLIGGRALGGRVDMLKSLYAFHQWLNGLGERSSDMLAMLEQRTLTQEGLASVMETERMMIDQAMVCAGVTDINNWQNIYRVLQWRNVSNALNVMPSTVRQLLNLQYVSQSGRTEDDSWQHWQNLAYAMEAAVDGPQAQALEALTAERFSNVLSAWFRTYCQPDDVFLRNRDELYSYLLIDNQVSAQVKTTRLAEALASLQLYINRALNRMEQGTRTDVITRQFFLNWSLNSRYSSWSGVSMLAYYPENYIDPTLRIGQTRMMDELLENISQGKLSQDAVEDAFRTYLTRFETVADLTVVNAYHDNVNSDSGTTWLLGRSKENLHEYHWRTVDMSKLQHGMLPANAWGEWTHIEMPLNAWKDMVRPVMFRERLYIIWVEREESGITEDNGQVKNLSRFILKLAFRRHDGTWSAPWNYDITTQIENILQSGTGYEPALSAVGFSGEDTLLVFMYRTAESYAEFGERNNSVTGLAVYGDGTFSPLTNTQLVRYSELSNTFDTIDPVTDVVTRRANYRFAINYDVPSSLILTPTHNSTDFEIISSANLSNISCRNSSDSVIINVGNGTISIDYNASIANMSSIQEAIQASGSSDEYIIFSEQYAAPGVRSPYPFIAYNKRNGIAGAFEPTSWTSTYLIQFLSQSGSPIAELPLNSTGPNHHRFNVTDSMFRLIRTGRLWYMGNSGPIFDDSMHYAKPVDIGIFSPNNLKLTIGNETFQPDSIQQVDKMAFFRRMEINISSHFENAQTALVNISATINASGTSQGSRASGLLRVNKVDLSPNNIFQLKSSENGAQYMQVGVHRIRLNTLLGPQLVSRATTGIDAILSTNTQHLPEPQLGKGFYATFTLPAYDADVHGTNRNFHLHLKHVVDNNAHVIYSGQFQDQELTARVFIPLDLRPLNPAYVAKVFLTTQRKASENAADFVYFSENMGEFSIQSITPSLQGSVSILQDDTEPMDFNGACALYLWELFYYTPMMAFQRLLQEQNFSEATRWIHYVWNPDGYIVQGQLQNYFWNVRPLEEETSWNANPLNSVDPDAVAQADPMHYKVATFMRMLDLLIARGDSAYRQLERDTLNEAKMWYVQALTLLGDEPDLTFSTHWGEPTLAKAADKTLQSNYQHMLARISNGEELLPEMRTANSLTGLFLPEFNEALSAYWKTLRQRLFNLRHNLTIDGMPLSLPLFADRADPSQLLSSMVLNAQESSHLPVSMLTLWRFQVILERARNTVGQLTQFGTTLLRLAEHQDADELNTLLMHQGMELVTQSIRLQERVVNEVAADREVIQETRRGVQARLTMYQRLWEEGISRQEQNSMDMQTRAGYSALGAQGFLVAASITDMLPNIFGLAVGGNRWGAGLQAAAESVSIGANAALVTADKMTLAESYRRRREEWEIQRDAAESELRQLDAQLRAMDIRHEAAELQVEYLQTQQAQTLAQMEFLQRKFTNQALYNWMRGKLSAIYYQFFDLSQSLCLMAQEALRREINDPAATYIRGGAWNGSSAGFMAGETLLLNLTEMEKVWLERDARAFEVTRTVSLAQVYRELDKDGFELADKLAAMLNSGSGSSGVTNTELKFSADGQLQASVQLAKLAISDDYPAGLGKHRQIKQISVTLPALVGPYEDVRAVLNYGGSMAMPKGCNAIAVSHGLNDSGQFFLDFNDARYLPFEGIPVDDSGSLTLSFPDATGRQKALLQSLNDIILHIRYTIQA